MPNEKEKDERAKRLLSLIEEDLEGKSENIVSEDDCIPFWPHPNRPKPMDVKDSALDIENRAMTAAEDNKGAADSENAKAIGNLKISINDETTQKPD
jgi:hypothetical protein